MAVLDQEVVGPLGQYGTGFGEELVRLGFRDGPAESHLRLLCDFSGWLECRGLDVEDVTEVRVTEFFAARRVDGYRRHVTSRALAPLLGYLRRLGVLAQPSRPVPVGPAEKLLEDYHDYLVGERGLQPAVVACYDIEAAAFLAAMAPEGPAGLAVLTLAGVSEFITAAALRRSPGSVANLVPALRSLLRYVHLRGMSGESLDRAVPSLAVRRDRRIPTVLSPDQVDRLIASCDRRSGIGRRDHAMLVVLARLGLRAGEVACLALDDIDWVAGQVLVHRKGPRQELLPLPADVGETIVAYLRRGRPPTQSRAVFVRAVAPWVALSGAGVSWVVYAACDRAGLPRVGAHVLRHFAASRMLAAGSSLTEIGQVLGHRRTATSAIYAKVDSATLGLLARPWPGAAS